MRLYYYQPGTGLAIKQYYEAENILWRMRTIDNSAEELLAVLYDFYNDLKAIYNPLFKDIEQALNVKICRIYDYQPGTGQATKQFYKYIKAIGHETIDIRCLTKDKIITMILSKIFDDME